MHKAVFLDRDGVLNRCRIENGKPYAPALYRDFQLYQGVEKQLLRLKAAGFLLVVVTNQPDVGNKLTSLTEVEKMHEHLDAVTKVDLILACYHSQNAGCFCRKPNPGMLHTAAEKMNISPELSFIIGDRWSDIEAGKNFGCRTILIDRHYKEKMTTAPRLSTSSLREAITKILETQGNQ